MQLYSVSNTNDTDVPWEMENEWVFTIELNWQSWLLGVERHGDSYSAVWRANLGPLCFIYYRRN
jgi:hypothetical protein